MEGALNNIVFTNDKTEGIEIFIFLSSYATCFFYFITSFGTSVLYSDPVCIIRLIKLSRSYLPS